MKSILYVILPVVLITTSCKPKTVDVTTAKSEITAQLNKYWDALIHRDISSIESLLTDNGLFCGTDPKELLDKKGYVELSKQTLADTSIKWKYVPKNREIRLVGDGNSAIALDQFLLPGFSAKIEFRLVAYLVKTKNNWEIDFLSLGAIPLNEDFEKLNKALE